MNYTLLHGQMPQIGYSHGWRKKDLFLLLFITLKSYQNVQQSRKSARIQKIQLPKQKLGLVGHIPSHIIFPWKQKPYKLHVARSWTLREDIYPFIKIILLKPTQSYTYSKNMLKRVFKNLQIKCCKLCSSTKQTYHPFPQETTSKWTGPVHSTAEFSFAWG